MTLEATLLRHSGRLLASKRPLLIGGWSRLAAPTLSSTTSGGSLRFSSSWYHHKSTTSHRSIHSTNLTNLAIASPSLPKLRTLTPTVRDAILSDLQQVDIDQNGIISSDELKVLLSKHATSFTDDEVVELTELFYASTGGKGVEIYRFLEALDAAIEHKSTSGGGEMSEDERSPLVEGGKFKTHPLGIGTCASEYSELCCVHVYLVCSYLVHSNHFTTSTFANILQQCSPRHMANTPQSNLKSN